MVEKLFIPAQNETPEVNFNVEARNFSIKGKSFPENPTNFYQPILDWLKDYTKNPLPKTDFHFHINYMNSTSHKMVFEIFHTLESALEKSKVTIYWYCEKEDLTEDQGIELEALTKCNIKFVYLDHEEEDIDDLY